MKVNVNGKGMTPISNIENLYKHIHGIPKGSVVIISPNCEVNWDIQMYANDRGIKIIRAD